jgi:hypothetical protein
MKTILSSLLILTSTVSAITPGDASEILFMKQEEKLARDVYQSLGDLWGTQVFFNINRSEQRHMNSVDSLIAQFALEDTCPIEPGVFTIPELQELYDTLMAKGVQSEKDALEVGVLVEETDIADLKVAIDQIDDATVDQIFGNLLRASYNHLNAFNSALTNGASGPRMQQRRAGSGQARFSWEGGNESLGEPLLAAVLERSVAGSDLWTTVMDVSGLTAVTVEVADDRNVLHRLRVETGSGAVSQGKGNGNVNGGLGPVSSVVYSNTVTTLALDTPWPDATWADTEGRWLDTWAGWMEITHYPWSYQNGTGWYYIVTADDASAWAWSSEWGWQFSAESVYPWIYDTDDGWIEGL